MSWHSESHPLRQTHSKEGRNSRNRMSLRLRYGAVRPSTGDSNQVSERLVSQREVSKYGK